MVLCRCERRDEVRGSPGNYMPHDFNDDRVVVSARDELVEKAEDYDLTDEEKIEVSFKLVKTRDKCIATN